MRLVILLLLCAALVTGCSHTFILVPDSPQQAFDDANREGDNYRARVIMLNGDRHVAHSVHIAADSTSWNLVVGDTTSIGKASATVVTLAHRQVFPTWDIRDIRITNETRGTRDGAFFGTLGGVVVGVALSGVGWHYLPSRLSYADPTTLEIVLDTFAGACIGAISGKLIGSTSIIRFEHGPTPR
jgi:hypothetical protein